MYASLSIRSLQIFLLPFLVAGLDCLAEEAPIFAVKFADRGVAFSGVVPSEEAGLALASAVKAVRPDLEILNEGLRIQSDVNFPPLGEIKSLLAELGLSTHEGGFALWDDAVLLSGLTDSRITLTALTVRLGSLLDERELINRLCIVPSGDLPDISVKLASGQSVGPLLDFDSYPSAEETFLPPGLPLEKLFPTMAMMSDLTRFDPPSDNNEKGGTSLRAIPLMSSVRPEAGDSSAAATILRAIPAGPQTTYVELEPIRFSRSSFLLQANQKPIIENAIKQLNTAPLAGKKVSLKPLRNSGGSGAFGQYLSDKRSAELQSLLVEGGIDRQLISISPVDSNSPIDEGIVRIVVEIPPPPPEEAEETEMPAEGDASEEETAEKKEPASSPQKEIRVKVGSPIR